MWLRVDRKYHTRGFFDNMADRPIRSGEWAYYEIVGKVAPDATSIYLGLILYGNSAVVDDASLEILADLPVPGTGALVNNAALHHEHNAANGGDVFQRIAVQGDDVRLQAGGDRANLIAHAQGLSAQ